MSWYSYSDPYESAARIRAEIEKRRKKGEAFEPFEVEKKRGSICDTFWGKAWCDNLESYSDYEHRLPRGRTYLRKGNVYDLEIGDAYIFAYVTGTEIYEVNIGVSPMKPKEWADLKKRIGGQVGNLVELLSGRLGAGVMEAIVDPATGLFPKPRQIDVNCNCPDWATLCKHGAAVLYAIGAQFDRQPELLFELRGVDHRELIGAATENIAAMAGDGPATASRILAAEDLSDLFGIEIAEPEMAMPEDL
jgi:uncharacterized Zn finger protein